MKYVNANFFSFLTTKKFILIIQKKVVQKVFYCLPFELLFIKIESLIKNVTGRPHLKWTNCVYLIKAIKNIVLLCHHSSLIRYNCVALTDHIVTSMLLNNCFKWLQLI